MSGTHISMSPFRFGVDAWNGDAILELRDGLLSATVATRGSFTSLDAALKPARDVFPQGIASMGAAMQIFSGIFDGLMYALREDLRLSGRLDQPADQFQRALSAGRELNQEMTVLAGYDRLSRLLFSDALAQFEKAAETAKDNPAIQLQLGFLHLFGRDPQASCIDLEKAAAYLSECRKYAQAYPDKVDPVFSDLTVRHFALCLYLRASEARRQNAVSESEELLRQVDALLRTEERRLSPATLQFAARISLLLGDIPRCAALVANLSDSQWFMLRDCLADPEFAPAKSSLERVQSDNLASPGPQMSRTLAMLEKTRRALATADIYDEQKQMSNDRKQLREALLTVEKSIAALEGTAELARWRMTQVFREARALAARAADLHLAKSRERRQRLQTEMTDTERILSEQGSLASRLGGGSWVWFLSVGLAASVMTAVLRLFRVEFGGSIVRALWPSFVVLGAAVIGAVYLAFRDVSKRGAGLARYRNRLQQLQPMIETEDANYQRWLKIQNELAAQNWDPDLIEVVPSRSESARSAQTATV